MLVNYPMELPETQAKPLLIYDGNCDFCAIWVNHWRKLTGDTVDYAPFQEVETQYPQITHEQFEGGVQLVMPDGTIYRNAQAVFRLLRDTRLRGWLWWLYENVPGFAPVTEWFYRQIARHRDFAYRVTWLLWGNPGPHSYNVARWLFLRGLGIIYLIAFASFGTQALGLVGSQGILPVDQFIGAVSNRFPGLEGVLRFPTLSLFDRSDTFLLFLCWGGVVLAILLILDMLATPVLILLFVFYLSLVFDGQTFMGFQWESLLLETGFLAIFLSSTRLLPGLRGRRAPSLVIIYLLRWLLFRLMFASGAVKLLSGDPNWHNLTAMNYHYWTQPIPNVIAWYMAQLPEWFLKFSTLFTFFIELIVPFLFFAPRRIRFAAGLLTIFLQLLILTTGNYTYFNWLAILLCIPLFDDDFLRLFIPRRIAEPIITTSVWTPRHPVQRIALTVFAVFMLFVTSMRFLPQIFQDVDFYSPLPAPVTDTINYAFRWRLVGGYGLFAVMTTSRPEIIVQGSNDGETWLDYEFPYKPGDVNRMPPFVAPHQPRLDWQMWFAALGGPCCQRADWFPNFVFRLLQGSPDVLALLARNPFPDAPPRYIRAIMTDYRFTDSATRASTGAWWQRDNPREYLRPVSLEDFQQGS